VTNGKGLLAEGILTVESKRCVVFELHTMIKKEEQRDLPTIAISPTKNIDRFEWFLEKATEIGVARIIPILCQNSERKVLKKERLNKIIVGAMKQSGRLWMPVMDDLVKIKDVIESTPTQHKLIAHCHEGDKLNPIQLKKEKNSIILIGPEGGFSSEEVEFALQNQFKEISLGEYRLRSETAGIVACHLFA